MATPTVKMARGRWIAWSAARKRKHDALANGSNSPRKRQHRTPTPNQFKKDKEKENQAPASDTPPSSINPTAVGKEAEQIRKPVGRKERERGTPNGTFPLEAHAMRTPVHTSCQEKERGANQEKSR